MMEKQIKILLINPPTFTLQTSPPIGLAYIATVLDTHGYTVKMIDTAAIMKPLVSKDVASIINEFQPDIVGMSLYTEPVKYAYEMLRYLKRSCKPFIAIAGGPHVDTNADEALEYGFDIAVIGEAEETILDIVAYAAHTKKLSAINGIAYKENGAVTVTSPRGLPKELDNIPIIKRSLIDFTAYDPDWYNPQRKDRVINLTSSRGCVYSCTFCGNIIRGRSVRYRSVENVLQEMRQAWEEYGVDNFVFVDDFFTLNRNRLIEFCTKIKADRSFKPKWRCGTRANQVDRELLTMMRDAGCSYICFGLESANEQTLKKIKKEMDPNTILGVIELMKEIGIKCQINYMWGFPWEDEAMIENTLEFMRKTKKDIYRFSESGVLVPLPGTEIYNEFHKQYKFTKWWIHRIKTWEYKPFPFFRETRYFSNIADLRRLNYNFFNYSPRIRKAIIKGLQFRDTQEWNDYRRFPRYQIFMGLKFISKMLYSIHPKLERLLLPQLFALLSGAWKKSPLFSSLRKRSAFSFEAERK